MPTISAFYGILIRMYYNDHNPAHFHALYGGYEATVDVERLCILEGDLPRRALELPRGAGLRPAAELSLGWCCDVYECRSKDRLRVERPAPRHGHIIKACASS